MAKTTTITEQSQPTRRTEPATSSIFRVLADGLYELRVSPRVVLDLLVTLDGELLTFLRVDGELLTEIPIAGRA